MLKMHTKKNVADVMTKPITLISLYGVDPHMTSQKRKQHDYNKTKRMVWRQLKLVSKWENVNVRWSQLLTIVTIFCQRFIVTIGCLVP